MNELKPKNWVFAIPEEERSSYILYAPLHHLTARISDQAQNILVRLLHGQEVFGEESGHMKKVLADEGLMSFPQEWEVAKDAIDSLISETLSSGNKEFSILFHGGGEAFVEYFQLQQCVKYANERAGVEGLKASFSAVTNATLITPERAQWLKDSGFTHFTVSLDGVREVHNRQRPHFKGIESFDKVMSGIR